MLHRQIEQLLLKDTFNLFDFSKATTSLDVINDIKEKFKSASYDTLLFYECLRMKNYASTIFDQNNEEEVVDQNDEVVNEYIESLTRYVEDIDDSEVKLLVGYITK